MVRMKLDKEALGRAAFEGLGQPTGAKWDNIGSDQRAAWRRAAEAAVTAALKEMESDGIVVLDLSSMADVLPDVSEVLRAATTGLDDEDASVLDDLADAFDDAAEDPLDRDCHSCEAPPGTPCAADCASR